MPKKKKGAKKPAAAAPAPAPAPAPEPAVEDAVPAAAAKGDAAKTAKSLDSVTDGFATGQKMGTDVSTMNAAVASLGSQDPAKAAAEAAQRERAAKLAQVKLVPEDIAFYVENCCCGKDDAERALREAGGNLKAALVAFVKA